MTEEKLKALEEKARAATAGLWKRKGLEVYCLTGKHQFSDICDTRNESDAAYIVHANPADVLELIGELRQAREELEAAKFFLSLMRRDWQREEEGS